MAIRKASAYTGRAGRPYTRTAKTRYQAYIKTVPYSKIVKYEFGNLKDSEAGKHKYRVRFVAGEKCLIRDNSLEACRMYITKVMDTKIPGAYYFSIRVRPHHFIRENKTAAGAGADRMSTGMSHSFGVVIGRAAIIPPGKDIFYATCVDDKAARVIRDAMNELRPKIPCKGRVVFEKIG
jgi:large subunit ribosomal protein L10e